MTLTIPLDEAIRSQLLRDAERLRPNQNGSVDVEKVLRLLGVELLVEVSSQRASHGSLMRTRDGYKVVIRRAENRQDEGLTYRERFTVAHEVAHLFVESRLGYQPRTASEYWKLEAICNEFAGRLLVAPAALDLLASVPSRTSIELLETVQRLASRCAVSFQVASHEVAARLSGVSLGEIERSQNLESAELGTVLWSAERSKFIGGRGTHVTAQHHLAGLLSESSFLAAEAKEISVGGVTVAAQTRGRFLRVGAVLPGQSG